MSETRFLKGYREETSDDPGLVQEIDGTVWLVNPDGTRSQITAGGATAAATLTADRAGGFEASHIFDLGEGPHTVQTGFALTAVTPDGETFGQDPGDIYVQLYADTGFPVTSDDGVGFVQTAAAAIVNHSAASGPAVLFTLGDFEIYLVASIRYLRVNVAIWDDTFAIYSGPNDPVAEVEIGLIYS